MSTPGRIKDLTGSIIGIFVLLHRGWQFLPVRRAEARTPARVSLGLLLRHSSPAFWHSSVFNLWLTTMRDLTSFTTERLTLSSRRPNVMTTFFACDVPWLLFALDDKGGSAFRCFAVPAMQFSLVS